MIKRARWSAEEIAKLRDIFPKIGAHEAAKHLPGRSPASIATMASKLKVARRGRSTADCADIEREENARRKLERLVSGSWL